MQPENSIRPQDCQVPYEALDLISDEIARTYRVCPIDLQMTERGEKILTLACEHPDDLHLIDDLQRRLNCQVRTVRASAQNITLGIAFHYSAGTSSQVMPLFPSDPTQSPAGGVIPAVQTPAPLDDVAGLSASQLLNLTLQSALKQRASDVHFEPHETEVVIRLRVDGILKDNAKYATELHPSVAARLKVLTNLDVVQSRLPQDGRFDMQYGERRYDIRVSFLPSLSGESIVLRLLPKGTLSITFNDLGLTDDNKRLLESFIHGSSGMLLLTGPTGSGKTTTLYACLSWLDSVARKVITIEDPVEYQFRRIIQTQVNQRSGLTFATGLRSILRQDPDVIMIGEIRDLEALEIATHSALTGHLVFSTLHCTDASAAAARMVDMGVEPFLVASSVSGIVAQRLVRKICLACKTPFELSDRVREQLNLPQDGTTYYHGRGCQVCAGSGYYGRMSIFEVMPMGDAVSELIAGRASAGEIRRFIRAQGIRSLRDDGIEKARAGITSLEEVLRVVCADGM